MPEDVKTSDLSRGLVEESSNIDQEIREEVPAAASLVSTESDSKPTEADTDEPPRIELTCDGCRRKLRIRGSYLGRFVICQHCGRRFLARFDVGQPGDGSVNSPDRESMPLSPRVPHRGEPANGSGGFERLAERIRREFRLERPFIDPRVVERKEGLGGHGPGQTFRSRDSSEDRLKGERDSALAEVARLTAELDELKPGFSGLEARLLAGSDASDRLSRQDEDRCVIEAEWRESTSAMEARIKTLEGELDRERAEHGAAMIRHQEARDQLEQVHAEAIERAIREGRSSGEAEREELRTRLDHEGVLAASEITGLLARADQERQSAEAVGRDKEAAVRRAEGVQRERDLFIARCGELEEQGRELEVRLTALGKEAEFAAEEAERLHWERADGLSRELELARDRYEAAGQQISSLEGRVEELLSSLGREFERAEDDREGLEDEIARLRRDVEVVERDRDAERERAAGLASGADELAARIESVKPALASLQFLEAEVERQSAELARARENADSASRQNFLLLEQLSSLRAERDSKGQEKSVTRSLLIERAPSTSGEDRRPDRESEVEVVSEHGEIGRQGSESVIEGGLECLNPPPVETSMASESIVPVSEDEASRKVQSASDPTASAPNPTPTPMKQGRAQGREGSIVLRGVSKEYYRDNFRIPVLENLDLSVEQGEFLALMGPSGSGKTTLLNLIAGLDQATTGSVVVHGRELTGLHEAELTRWRANNVGFVFQMYNLIPVMTAFRNVELPLLLTQLSRRQRRENAMTALRIVGLEGREDHYPRQLSGGQEQRVSIARAIVTDPHLIVADEPTGDLDRNSADEILNLLGSLNREFHKMIVMVTHDPLAARRATRTLHLDKGKLVGDTIQPRIWKA